jgi:RNA polymerase sigma-70 factor (sigma-E family)
MIAADRQPREPHEDAEFDDFYRTHRMRMVRLAVLLIDRRSEADEVVQEAFAAVHQRWSDLDVPAAYLRRTVVNRCHDVRRRRRHRREVVLDDQPVAEPSGDELRDVIASLPDKQRTVIVLRYYEDLSIESIADLTGMPVGTVKSSLHRALAQLRLVVER